jgi:hypothetical protein
VLLCLRVSALTLVRSTFGMEDIQLCWQQWLISGTGSNSSNSSSSSSSSSSMLT